jgi:hypothetical protein
MGLRKWSGDNDFIVPSLKSAFMNMYALKKVSKYFRKKE